MEKRLELFLPSTVTQPNQIHNPPHITIHHTHNQHSTYRGLPCTKLSGAEGRSKSESWGAGAAENVQL